MILYCVVFKLELKVIGIATLYFIFSVGVEQQSISFTLELILTAILKSQTGSTPIQVNSSS